jgi:hypothetical protein
VEKRRRFFDGEGGVDGVSGGGGGGEVGVNRCQDNAKARNTAAPNASSRREGEPACYSGRPWNTMVGNKSAVSSVPVSTT